MTLQDWTNFATIMAMAAALIGLALALKQLSRVREQLELTQKQLRDDHEYRRRAATIEVTNTFSRELGKKLGLSRRIIATLDKAKCHKLEKLDRFEVDAKACGPLLLALFERDELIGLDFKEKDSGTWTPVGETDALVDKISAGSDGTLRLALSHVATIRQNGVAYQNLLESVFLAARLEVVDSKEILDEFETLVNETILGDYWEIGLSKPHSNLRWAKEIYLDRKKKHSAERTGV